MTPVSLLLYCLSANVIGLIEPVFGFRLGQPPSCGVQIRRCVSLRHPTSSDRRPEATNNTGTRNFTVDRLRRNPVRDILDLLQKL